MASYSEATFYYFPTGFAIIIKALFKEERPEPMMNTGKWCPRYTVTRAQIQQWEGGTPGSTHNSQTRSLRLHKINRLLFRSGHLHQNCKANSILNP